MTFILFYLFIYFYLKEIFYFILFFNFMVGMQTSTATMENSVEVP